jgi:hypothetical protein
MSKLLLAVLTFAACQGVPYGQQAATSKRAQGPSLEETEHWIQQTFTTINTGRDSCQEYIDSANVGYGPFYTCFYESYQSIKFEGCTLWLQIHERSGGVNNHGLVEDSIKGRDDTSVEIHLGDIDPASIKVGSPMGVYGKLGMKTLHDNPAAYADLTFRTTNDEDKITIYANRSEHYNVHACCGIISEQGIALRPDYAPRFTKALSHAVELCGGKSSPF